MTLSHIAFLSVHASPLAALGGEKTGGMNVYIRELAQEFGRRGILVDIFTRRISPFASEIDNSLGTNVRVIHIDAGPDQTLPPDDVFQYIANFTAGVMAFCTRNCEHYDLIYSHYWLSGFVAKKLKDVWGIPFVQMFHTLGQMKQRISTGPVYPPDVRIINEGKIVEWADRVIAATPAEQTQLRWLYRTDRRKVRISSPGVNENLFFPVEELDAKSALGMPSNIHQLLFVGRIEPLKGVDTILLALSHMRTSNPEDIASLMLTVIGGNPRNPDDKELIRLRDLTLDLGLADHVQFIGSKAQNELRNFYAASTAVLIPSDYESFGMVALEAMACGTPVIASYTGGLAYLIKDGISGFLVPVRDEVALANSLRTLLNDPQLVTKMRAAAADIAKYYRWSAIADNLLEVFGQILNDSARFVSHHKS